MNVMPTVPQVLLRKNQMLDYYALKLSTTLLYYIASMAHDKPNM